MPWPPSFNLQFQRHRQEGSYQDDDDQHPHTFERLSDRHRPDNISRNEKLKAQYNRSTHIATELPVGFQRRRMPESGNKPDRRQQRSYDDRQYTGSFQDIAGYIRTSFS